MNCSSAFWKPYTLQQLNICDEDNGCLDCKAECQSIRLLGSGINQASAFF